MKDIPVLCVFGENIARAYENAIVDLYKFGIRVKTQYDKPEDPLSLDSTMNITIDKPDNDPMIHKAFPGGPADLREYVMELCGVKDHWIKNFDDPNDTRWEYTYHQRLKRYGYIKTNKTIYGVDYPIQDQIEIVVEKLINQPFTRQAQMITWMPNIDNDCYDPPCLQSLHYRILEEDNIWYLNCNVRFRSNDAWGANFMNMFGLTQFNKILIGNTIALRTGKVVRLGRMNWQADSYHIYGKDIKQAEDRLFSRINKTKFVDRIMNFYDPEIQEIYNEAEADVMKKIKEYDRTHFNT